MFPVTITIHNNDQLSAVLAAMSSKPVEASKPKVESAKPKAEAKPEPKAEVKETKKSEAPKEAVPEKTDVTYQDVAAAITQVSRQVGRDDAVAILAKFDAKKGPDLKPEQFAEVLAACQEVLK